MKKIIKTFLYLWLSCLLSVQLFGATSGKLDTLRFRNGSILYAPGQEKLANTSVKQISKTVQEISEMLNFVPQQPFLVVIANTQAVYWHFTDRRSPDWSAGITDYTNGTIVLKSPKLGKTTLWDYDETLRHEIAHMVIGQNVDPMRLPRWLNEGLAMVIAGQHSMGQMYTLAQHVANKSLISLTGLEQLLHFSHSKASLGYAESHSAVQFILKEFPKNTLEQVLHQMQNSDLSWAQSFSEVTGLSQFYFEQHWRSYLEHHYKWLAILSSDTWIWLLFPLLAILAFLAIKWRNYRKMQQWQAEEEQLDKNSDWDFEYLPDEDEKWRGDIH